MPKTGDKRYTQSSWSRDYDRERALKKRRKRSEEQVAAKYAEEIDCPYLDLNIFPIDQVNLNFIPKEKAKEYEIVLLKKVGREVKVGAVDPKREDLQEYINKLEEKNGVKVKLHVVPRAP